MTKQVLTTIAVSLCAFAAPGSRADAGNEALQRAAARARTLAESTTEIAPALPAEPPPVCNAGTLKPVRFRGSEHLMFRLDVLGAELGTFEMRLERAPANERGRASLRIQARGKSSDIITSNLKRIDGWSSALMAADGSPVQYREELDEGGFHFGQDVEFPAREGALSVRATKNGDPAPVSLQATREARDLLSGLFVLRRQDLTPRSQMCAEIYAAKRMWRVEGTVADKAETVETPFGKVEAIRLDTVATRLDDEKIVRKAHVWITTDDRRLPVVILGDIRGRFIRAQMTEAKVGRERVRRAARN